MDFRVMHCRVCVFGCQKWTQEHAAKKETNKNAQPSLKKKSAELCTLKILCNDENKTENKKWFRIYFKTIFILKLISQIIRKKLQVTFFSKSRDIKSQL